MQNITKTFFGKPANDGVTITVEKGEIQALLGENGAGKTTLMNILYGIYQKDDGHIFWKEQEVNFKSPREALTNRIGMVHQHFMLVPTLSVSENITLGIKAPGFPFINRKELNKSIHLLSEKYGLGIQPETLVKDLSVGEEQRVEIMKLLYRDAELLILDEPTAVLTPGETDRFFQILQKLKCDGKAVILITHRIPEVMAVTDRINILRDGKKVADLSTAETSEAELSRLMIGRDLIPVKIERNTAAEKGKKSSLEVIALSSSEKKHTTLKNVSFSIQQGEILGIAGVDGNGQKTLAECLTGISRSSNGKILINGQDVSLMKSAERYKKGLAYIPDDRHHDGLVLEMNIEENYILNSRRRDSLSKYGFTNAQKSRTAVNKAVRNFSIKTENTQTPIRLLSGGNQQKLILARELEDNPQVVIAFQPTRGLDIGASEFTRKQLVKLRDLGSSILLISTDLDEIQSLSDKIAVMFEGHLSQMIVNDAAIDMSRIGQLMAGHRFTEAEK